MKNVYVLANGNVYVNVYDNINVNVYGGVISVIHSIKCNAMYK